jgi:hypothetical protein
MKTRLTWIRNAPNRTAIPALVGTPNATIGTKAPPSRALVALSAAMTPRMSPLPKVSDAPFSVRSAWP